MWRTVSFAISKQETHQEIRDPNVTSLHFATPLVFNALDAGFLWDDLRKILHGGQKVAKVQNGVNKYCTFEV